MGNVISRALSSWVVAGLLGCAAGGLSGCAAQAPPGASPSAKTRPKPAQAGASKPKPSSEAGKIKPPEDAPFDVGALAGVHACKEGSAEHTDAHEKLKQVTRLMKEKKEAAFGEVVPLIRELIASPCYARVSHEPEAHLDFDGPAALAAWWPEGRGWLESYLFIPPQGSTGGPRSGFEMIVAPDVRHILDARLVNAKNASRERRALAWLVCKDDETECGQSTAGWALRADAAFEAAAFRDAFYSVWQADAFGEQIPSQTGCEKLALAAEMNQRLRVFRGCLEKVQLHQWAMPLGRFRSPDNGWLIVRGRRGHYAFCDELRAYDLATGAAYIAQSCSGLEFGDSGFVDNAKVDAGRKVRVQMGSMSADNLRELAFAMLLSPEVERDLVLRPRRFDVPAKVFPVMSDGPRIERYSTPEMRNSGQTRLSWALVRGGKTTNNGSFVWPGSSNVAEAYVEQLLDVAEGGFQKGCPPAALPPRGAHRGKPAEVNALDASEQSLDAAEKALEDALWTAKAPASCGSAAQKKP